MNRPRSPSVRRPKAAGAGAARDRKSAAIQLVRLEFDINRLERAISMANSRAAAHQAELRQQMAERAKLMAILRD